MSLADAPVRYTLHPGDVCLATRGDGLETLLGSCIAVVLTDPRRTVAAMCHFVHAAEPDADAGDDTTCAGPALRRMCELLVGRGIAPQLCEAYVYGGGDMYPVPTGKTSVGRQNQARALDALQRLGVRVLEAELGGTQARKLRWTVGPAAPQSTNLPAWESTCP